MAGKVLRSWILCYSWTQRWSFMRFLWRSIESALHEFEPLCSQFETSLSLLPGLWTESQQNKDALFTWGPGNQTSQVLSSRPHLKPLLLILAWLLWLVFSHLWNPLSQGRWKESNYSESFQKHKKKGNSLPGQTSNFELLGSSWVKVVYPKERIIPENSKSKWK